MPCLKFCTPGALSSITVPQGCPRKAVPFGVVPAYHAESCEPGLSFLLLSVDPGELPTGLEVRAGRRKAGQQEWGLGASGRPQPGRCPPHWGGPSVLPSSPFGGADLFWKYSPRHIQKQCFTSYLGIPGYPQSSWNIKITIPDTETSVSLKFQYFINLWYKSQAYILTNISIDLEIYTVMWKKQIAEQHVCYETIFINIKPQNNLYIFVHIHKAIYQLLPLIISGVKMEEKLEINICFYIFGLFHLKWANLTFIINLTLKFYINY